MNHIASKMLSFHNPNIPTANMVNIFLLEGKSLKNCYSKSIIHCLNNNFDFRRIIDKL